MRTYRLAVVAMILIGPASLLTSTSKAGAAEKITLRPKFTKGEATRIVMTMDVTMDMTMDTQVKGMEMPTNMKGKMSQTYELIYHVTEVAKDGGITMVMTYDRVKQSMDMGPLKMEIDTRKADPEKMDPMAKGMYDAIKPMLGMKLTVKLDKDFKTTEVKGMEAYWEGLKKSLGGGKLIPQMEKMFGDEQFKQIMEQQFTRYLPPRAMAVGGSWKSSYKLPIPLFGDVQITSDSKLASVGDHKGKRCAKIDFKMEMKSTGSRPSKDMGMIGEMKIQRCKGNGHYWFDIEAGQMSEMVIDQTMDMSMKMNTALGGRGKKGAGGISMKQRIRSKIRMTTKPEPTTRPKS